jgi:hypothetical protein
VSALPRLPKDTWTSYVFHAIKAQWCNWDSAEFSSSVGWQSVNFLYVIIICSN